MLILNDFKKNKLISLIFTLPSIFFILNPFKIFEYKELLKDVKFSKTDVILDIGCGRGLQTILLGKKCKKIIGIDLSKESILTAKIRAQYNFQSNCEFRLIKLEDAAFRECYFDKIFSICVIEHIPNYIEVLEKAFKNLKNNGQMIFSVDSFETFGESFIKKHKKDFFVERYFKINELFPILKKIGFKDIKIYPIFRSSYAKSLMEKGIMNNLKFGLIRHFFQYFKLKKEEGKSNYKNKGIILVIKCKK